MDINELKRKIQDPNIKVISFDIFDTLLMRPCAQPTDILTLVGKRCGFEGDFLTMRRIAEKEARKNRRILDDEITFNDIYEKMYQLFDFTTDEIKCFKQVELQVEYEYLELRESMKEVYDFVIESGKELIIISDIYLDKDFIESVLRKNKYEGYSKIYLSSEYKLCKNTGRLYKLIIDEYQRKRIQPNEILHMGDNEKSDVGEAIKCGIQAIHIPRAEWIFRHNTYLRVLLEHSVINRFSDDTFLIGYAINKCYDNPFLDYKNDSYFDGNQQRFLNFLVAPIILSYMNGLLKRMSLDNSKTIAFHTKKETMSAKIFCRLCEMINFKCKIMYYPEYMDAHVDVLFGYIDEKEYVESARFTVANVYLSAEQYNTYRYNKTICGMIYDYDTNREAPLLSCFIDDILGELADDKKLRQFQICILNYISEFIQCFHKDMPYLWFDFTNFNDCYFNFLKSHKKNDLQILNGIKKEHISLFKKEKNNYYVQWANHK